MSLSRRSVLAGLPAVWVASRMHAAPDGSPSGAVAPIAPIAPVAPVPPLLPGASFPTQEPDLVREMVSVSHGQFEPVKVLVERHPTLAKAAWDWGYGDWETALGAASHVGSREVARYLLDHGAQPTIFAATMLGQLDVVKAFVVANPGIERTLGPHGLTLLHHARAGGDDAKPVLAYLTALGDADPVVTAQPLAPGIAEKLAGDYRYGTGADEIMQVTLKDERLSLLRLGRTPRGLTHRGDLEFFPAGAPNVSVRFHLEDKEPAKPGVSAAVGAIVLEIRDPDPVVRAPRS